MTFKIIDTTSFFYNLNININFFFLNEDLFLISFFTIIFLLFIILFKNNINKNNNNKNNKIKLNNLFLFLILLFLFIIFDLNILVDSNNFNENFLSIIFNFFFLISLILFYNYIIKTYNYEELFLLIFILITSKIILFSNNIILIILLLEIQTFSILTLNISNKQNLLKSEATLKYFIISSLASGLLLYSFSNIYNITGLINFNEINLYISFLEINKYYENNKLYLNFIIFFFAFLIKLGIFPFHNWILDVYDGFSYKLLFISTILQKPILFYLLFKIYNCFNIVFIDNFIIIFIIVSIIIGSLGVLNQSNIKKFIAYTSLVTNSYILLIILNNFLIFKINFIIYIFFYNILTILFFYVFINTNKNYLLKYNKYKNIFQFYNMLYLNKYKTLLLLITLFSFLGLPPFIGFFSKYFIMYMMILNNYIILSLIILLISVISAFYYLRIIKISTSNEKFFYVLNDISYLKKKNNNFFFYKFNINDIVFFFLFLNMFIFLKLDNFFIFNLNYIYEIF